MPTGRGVCARISRQARRWVTCRMSPLSSPTTRERSSPPLTPAYALSGKEQTQANSSPSASLLKTGMRIPKLYRMIALPRYHPLYPSPNRQRPKHHVAVVTRGSRTTSCRHGCSGWSPIYVLSHETPHTKPGICRSRRKEAARRGGQTGEVVSVAGKTVVIVLDSASRRTRLSRRLHVRRLALVL